MKRALGVAGAIVALAIAMVASIAGGAYVRGPKLMAQLERDGELPYSPADLPRVRLCALLAVQDRTFFHHRGIGLADGKPGHTTVTQSIGKWLLFDGFTPGRFRQRKVRLMIGALGLDASLTKEQQLRLFLNRGYFGSFEGRPVLGFPAAARAYFGKEMGALSGEEYLSLLAMLDAPNRDHVIGNPQGNRERAEAIAGRVRVACGAGCFEGAAPVPCAAW